MGDVYQEKTVVLLVGQTGSGKSTTFNQIFQENIQEVGDVESVTIKTLLKDLPWESLDYLADTRGFNDTTNVDDVKITLNLIADIAEYCSQNNETFNNMRFKFVYVCNPTAGRLYLETDLNLLTSMFGADVHDSMVILMTHDDVRVHMRQKYIAIEEGVMAQIGETAQIVPWNNSLEQDDPRQLEQMELLQLALMTVNCHNVSKIDEVAREIEGIVNDLIEEDKEPVVVQYLEDYEDVEDYVTQGTEKQEFQEPYTEVEDYFVPETYTVTETQNVRVKHKTSYFGITGSPYYTNEPVNVQVTKIRQVPHQRTVTKYRTVLKDVVVPVTAQRTVIKQRQKERIELRQRFPTEHYYATAYAEYSRFVRENID